MTPEKETPTTKTVEELIEQLFQYYDDIDCAVTVDQRITAKEQAELWLKRTLTQDRASLHTSLVAAVYKLPVYYRPIQVNADYSERDESADVVEMYSKAQVDTIINSIFKE